MFKNRIRLPFYLSKPQFPVERNVFRKADGSSQLLSAIIRNTYEGKTDQLPEDWHRKLIIALAHDEVTIEDNRLLTDVVLDGDYEIDWQDFLNYPIAQASFKIQTTPFNATNNNCQSCEDVTQLNLNDDYLGGTLEQGGAYSTPSILANDEICCYPFTVEIMTFNTAYFDYVIYEGDGVLSLIVKAVVPTLDNVLIATYRVTCENGAYDEANVYGNIVGTGTECPAPTNLQAILDDSDGTIATMDWDGASTSGGYNWWLYLCEDIYTPVQSGNVPSETSLDLTGLSLDQCYVFAVQADCGIDGDSDVVFIEFNTSQPVDPEMCGEFTIDNTPNASAASYSYFDCSGNIQSGFIANRAIRTKCMLMYSDTHTPVYFHATSPLVTYYYNDLC